MSNNERMAVKRLGESIGYGNMVELAHSLWDEYLESEWNIKNHSEEYILTQAEFILEARAKKLKEGAQ